MNVSNFAQRKTKAFDKCLDWISGSIDKFDLSSSSLNCHFGLKVLSEMNLLTSLYNRKLINKYDDRIRKITAFTTEQLEKIGYMDGVVRMPEFLSLYAFIYMSLYECGLNLEEFRKAILIAVDQESINSR